MKSRPMLFSAPMVRALLNGTKTQTRRAFKLPRGHCWDLLAGGEAQGFIERDEWYPGTWHVEEFRCPYGSAGDRLWVRERFRALECGEIDYFADGCETWERMQDHITLPDAAKWKPSIHMPRWASRIELEIAGVRVERLHDISDADAIAEGIAYDPGEGGTFHIPDLSGCCADSAVCSYRRLWESINGPGSWDKNPWVWVIEFKRVEVAL